MPRRPARRDGETLCRAVASDQSRRGRAESALRIYGVYRYRTTVGLRTQRSELDRLLIVFRCHAHERAAGSKAPPRRACRPRVRRRTATASGAGTHERAERSRRGRGGRAPGPRRPGASRRAGVQRRRNAGTRPRGTARSTIERYADSPDTLISLYRDQGPWRHGRSWARRRRRWNDLRRPPGVRPRKAADVCRPGRRVARRRTRYTRAAEATPGTPGARGPG